MCSCGGGGGGGVGDTCVYCGGGVVVWWWGCFDTPASLPMRGTDDNLKV